MDPRSDMTPAQVIAQHDAAIQLRDLTLRVNRVVAGDRRHALASSRRCRTSSPVDAEGPARWRGAHPTRLSGACSPTSTVRSKDLRHFRDSVLARPLAGLGYRQYPRLREEVQTVSGMVWRPLMPPTAGEMLRLGELKTETDGAQARFDAIIASRVAKINQALAGTPHVITPTKPRFTP